MALGARPDQVQRQVPGQGMALVASGVVCGLAGTLWATNLLRSLLFGVINSCANAYCSSDSSLICVGGAGWDKIRHGMKSGRLQRKSFSVNTALNQKRGI